MNQILMLVIVFFSYLTINSLAQGTTTNPPQDDQKVRLVLGDDFEVATNKIKSRYPWSRNAGYCSALNGCGGSDTAYAAFSLEKPDTLNIFPKDCMVATARENKWQPRISLRFSREGKLESMGVTNSHEMNDQAARQMRDRVLRDYRRVFGNPIEQITSEPPSDEGWQATWRTSKSTKVTLTWDRIELSGIHCAYKALPDLPIRANF